MQSWWRIGRKSLKTQEKKEVPDGVWLKCGGCGEILYRRELERNAWVCGTCGHHFRIPPQTYIQLLVDPDSFKEMFSNIRSTDPLEFRDSKRYADRLKAATATDPSAEAIISGCAQINRHPVAIGFMNFSFLGGSMASAVGERVSRLIQYSLKERIPLIIVSCSGGARMQEGALSLMQMAKTCAQLARLDDAGLPFISILTDPTTGGVTASFASLGDINIAEPNALIGFAGPRVIEQTINQELPPGFQRSEFLLEHGMIDAIIPRTLMREKLSTLLGLFYDSGSMQSLLAPSGKDQEGVAEEMPSDAEEVSL
ncbi:MAG: acetyl-CoA carboxylase, carboxyltransferase subunit beta [Candidatus Eisenbacteria bacterium]|uniref:Acetyl-coenzyme A carboxylase carboxyl transferase subunit beta n=1 Tax=Eiseniibacteriota bacterium TaxID=2212470 RepID=A0A948W4T4_UNCEI|nr:acetyl-CoA carboxylase, carboxyltransferase subunit beta [Candidatus Eisenbacteria bacterium]MBU1949277.1 acetyl-CoA carboxylase, carboxyltransferase subunit beta [Candidatus Eisenbacteria bacterium]MBU2689679.1 acetyl-CoA carboxylase, carboxyltransferase subunit beta [Candidatus Eisenbacteria bacterium]